ncbi:MAG: hypothetical protein ABI777_01695 [Betaproteobacteria bacterium]
MRTTAYLFLFGLLVTACSGPKEPVLLTPPQDAASSAVVREALPSIATPPILVAPPVTPGMVPPTAGALASVTVPDGVQYVCVADREGIREQTTIEFMPKVASLCRRHPEMGPCQFERNMCRRSGGRVFAANGVEITLQTEAEYDKKVMRVRFQAN